MNIIEHGVYRINELLNSKDAQKLTEFEGFVKERFKFSEDHLRETLSVHLDNLRSDLFVYVEFPYVDRVYRNSYYTYFSTKHHNYARDCIRLSFFNSPSKLNNENFREHSVKSEFLGYIVIRPISSAPIGRSMLSPLALKNRNIYCCLSPSEASVNGIKFKIKAFPHSSQDGETITCSETTVWSLMEYFGARYAEYKPVSPSTIISVLEQMSSERQLPSEGLTEEQISYALKKFGFGVKTYSACALKSEPSFSEIVYYYIESGIPAIGIVQDRKKEDVAHAVVLIGHDEITQKNIDKVRPLLNLKLADGSKMQIVDTVNISKKLVVIDDNTPAYQKVDFHNPTPYFASCEFTALIVPLYTKIYLDAFKARNLMIEIIKELFDGGKKFPEVFFRLFLTSSRSYKQKIAENFSDNPELRELIVETKMPRFVWVCELSTRTLYKKFQAIGLIIVDATEASEDIFKALILATFNDRLFYFLDGDKMTIEITDMKINPFPLYISNLNDFCHANSK